MCWAPCSTGHTSCRPDSWAHWWPIWLQDYDQRTLQPPRALRIRESGAVSELTGPITRPVGFGGAPPSVQTVQLAPGDWVLFFTDGVVEERLEGGLQFGEARLRELVEQTSADRLDVAETVRHTPSWQPGAAGPATMPRCCSWSGVVRRGTMSWPAASSAGYPSATSTADAQARAARLVRRLDTHAEAHNGRAHRSAPPG